MIVLVTGNIVDVNIIAGDICKTVLLLVRMVTRRGPHRDQ
ncbi:hypothetical protein LCGC14_1364860 [marine sediment metagenome]|uniref:Uncharacterized protein n=1 Tax=marine sediment metagenome TaxID=412755 RepID=A0A0F9KT61_9ZZZZ